MIAQMVKDIGITEKNGQEGAYPREGACLKEGTADIKTYTCVFILKCLNIILYDFFSLTLVL